jgi:hypothetical protein
MGESTMTREQRDATRNADDLQESVTVNDVTSTLKQIRGEVQVGDDLEEIPPLHSQIYKRLLDVVGWSQNGCASLNSQRSESPPPSANARQKALDVGTIPLPIDKVSTAMNNARRRKVLILVDELEPPVELRELALAVAAVENDLPVRDVQSSDRKRAYVSLKQNNLPTLHKIGVIEYHDRSGAVHPTDSTHGVAKLIRTVETLCSDTLSKELP